MRKPLPSDRYGLPILASNYHLGPVELPQFCPKAHPKAAQKPVTSRVAFTAAKIGQPINGTSQITSLNNHASILMAIGGKGKSGRGAKSNK